MREETELTRRLLAEGYKPEDTPPGMRAYNPYYGGWTYDSTTLRAMVFETPCGLLAKGDHFTNGHMSYGGIDWRPENDNPVICCPLFTTEPCPLMHPILQRLWIGCRSGDIARQCACHPTTRPYVYECSVDEASDRRDQETDRRWKEFSAAHKGRLCRHQSSYGRTVKKWHTGYDPMECARLNCQHYCDVLAKELDRKRGNVFYDLRMSWIEKGHGLFPDQQKVSIKKGCKLLDKTVSLTICKAIVKYGRHRVDAYIRLKYHHQLFFDPTLEIEVLNLRAARMDTRDIQQDLQDIANGIEVTHAADSLKAAKAQKRARREAAKQQRIRKIERMILAHGWDDLGNDWKRRAKKLLTLRRIHELDEEWERAKTAKPPADDQFSMFGAA